MAKKVTFLNRFYRPDESATAQILTDLAEHLAANGWQVEVVTSRLLYSGSGPALPPGETLNGVSVRRLWSTRFGRAWLPGRLLDYLTIYLSFAVHLLRRAGPASIVVVKTDPPLLSVLGWLVKCLNHYTLVSWCQDLFPEVAEAGLKPRRLLRPVFRCLAALRDTSLRESELVAVLGEDMARHLAARGLRKPAAVLPNWAVQPPEAPPAEVARLRHEWGLDGRFVLGYSGNLGRVHDWQTLHAAVPLLHDIDNLTLLFIGGGAGYSALAEKLASIGRPRLVFLPYQPLELLGSSLAVPDVHWLSLAPAMTPLVFPSKFYGILSAARPVLFVGDSRCGLARAIDASGCGCAVECGDAAALAGAVKRLAVDPALRQRMGARALALAAGEAGRRQALARWAGALGSLRVCALKV